MCEGGCFRVQFVQQLTVQFVQQLTVQFVRQLTVQFVRQLTDFYKIRYAKCQELWWLRTALRAVNRQRLCAVN